VLELEVVDSIAERPDARDRGAVGVVGDQMPVLIEVPNTWPISAAMNPPPMITIDRGSASSRMIVSEVWNGTSSKPAMGGTSGREPAATTIRSVVRVSPPTSSTLGATNRAASV
jgi:hypothetical protein